MPINVSTSLYNASSGCGYKDKVDFYMYPVAYSLFFIVGFPANCLSLYVACMLMQKGNNMAVYLVNLSVSDLLYTITLPVWIELALQRSVGDTLCTLINFIMYNSFYVGSGLLCCISVDRYLAVVFPLHYSWVHEVRIAALVSLLVWLTEILLHLALLAYTGDLQEFSVHRMCREKMPMSNASAHMSIIRVVLGFFVPLLIMGFCFQQILLALRGSVSTVASERKKIRNLLLLLLLTYVVAFSPFQVIMLLRGLLEPENCDAAVKIRDYYMVCVAMTTINSVADPIIYCLMSESAKTEMKAVWHVWKKKFHEMFQLNKIRTVSSVSQSVSSVH
ncbi:G-protein coupled receptor 4-like [Chanos chanos]|uniref:G-protein coupled receptor 4-like n=1 Tax=Chanos chanos TaxID=29144 RepID=A0A6J2WPS3_CHACN|nr:G-protein coupled receptor 4-like [Chanos chanos]